MPFWAHRHKIFGEWLYLSARNQDVDYATPVNGSTVTAVPIGQTSTFDAGYQTGLRFGGSLAIDRESSLSFVWTGFQGNDSDRTSLPGGAPPGSFLKSDLVHPRTMDVATDSLSSSGTYGVDFMLGDLDYTATLAADSYQRLNGSLGIRYGDLEQDLRVSHIILGSTSIQSDIDFSGFGPKIAADYENQNENGMLIYCRGGASLLFGQFDARYSQTSVFRGLEAANGISEDRIVPQLDLEFGTGWESANGAIRITAGYFISCWHNVLTTPAFIDGVQAGELDDIDETISFDGLAVRAEILY